MNRQDQLTQVLDIGIALTTEKEPNILLDHILETTMNLTSSDAGVIYTPVEDALQFRIMKNRSKGVDLGGKGDPIDALPVPMKKENICAYAAISREPIDVADIYQEERFDFSWAKQYDAENGYRTRSLVAIPMLNRDKEAIGVLQLVNAEDETGTTRPYTEEEKKMLLSLASQCAIALSNWAYTEELNRQIWSFTEALTEAIDARTPYNGSHTRKVAEYAGLIADRINREHLNGVEDLFFTEDHKKELIMAALLHDIGKMVIPISVMNKQTRLEGHLERIETRLEMIRLRARIEMLESHRTADDYAKLCDRIEDTLLAIREADKAGSIAEDLMDRIGRVSGYVYCSFDKTEEIPFLTEVEKDCLQIDKGTLTNEERSIMESHVLMTERILGKAYFNKKYQNVPLWAVQHHELIDGSGYPYHVGGESLSPEARILAVADICDALLATDRPYKKPMPREKAFEVMKGMAEEGKLELRFVIYLEEALQECP